MGGAGSSCLVLGVGGWGGQRDLFDSKLAGGHRREIGLLLILGAERASSLATTVARPWRLPGSSSRARVPG